MKLALLVTDLDNTLVGDDRALENLLAWLQTARQTQGIKLVYSTGRSLTLYQDLATAQHLPDPDALITAVGTEIRYAPPGEVDATWASGLGSDWDRQGVEAIAAAIPALTPQPASEQGPFKLSYSLAPDRAEATLGELRGQFQRQGLGVQMIYSGSEDLDLLPLGANKGAALQFVRSQWHIAPEQTLVCGDSGNDQALFTVGQERGVIVGNAQPELRQWHETYGESRHYLAQGCCAAGIWEALGHFQWR